MPNANRFKKGSGSFSCGKLNLTPLTPLLLVFLLAGCGGLLETQRPADERYWLEPLAENASAPLDGLELVFELNVVPGLDSERVLALGRDARLSHVGQARWADSLPDVLESVISRSLASNGARLENARRGERCQLQLEVQEFFARGAPASTATARMAGAFECGGRVTSIQLENTVEIASGQAKVVPALQRALDEATRELVARMEAASMRDSGE